MAELPCQSGRTAPEHPGSGVRGDRRLRVLIAGCGYVGTELGRRLAARGHEAWGLRRDPSEFPAEIRAVRADLTDPSLGVSLPEVDHVVYAASPDASTPEAYALAYVDGLRNLLSHAGEKVSASGRLVLVSSTAVYADAGGDPVDETTETKPDSFRGRILLEGERIAREGPLSATVFRLGGIYGPGRTRLIDSVRSGMATCPPGGPVWSNRIHRDDAARAVEHLLGLPDAPALLLGVDDEPSPICDVYRFVADLVGAPEPRVGEGAGRTRSNKRCSNRRLRGTGFEFVYPSYREGYASMLAGGAQDAQL